MAKSAQNNIDFSDIIHASGIITAETRKICAAIGKNRLRFVGGCVRNAILGEKIGDIDFATPLNPDLVIKALAAKGIKYVPTGIDHGTVTAVINGKGYEITTLRRDVETDGRHAVVAFTDDWSEDAARRDLTINALYADFDGVVYDPLGSGLSDITAHKVRFIGDPTLRIMEDTLRILRFFRFYTLYGIGKIDSKSLKACVALMGNMAKLSRERVTKEFLLILTHDNAPRTLKIMAESAILSEIIPQNLDTKPIVSLIKSQKLGENQEKDVIFATRLFLLRDAQSKKQDFDFKQLILNKKIVSLLEVLSNQKHKTHRIDTQKIQEFLYFYGPATTRAILDVTASVQGVTATLHRLWGKELTTLETPVFDVKGTDLMKMGIPAGPEMGATLKALEAKWIKSGFTLTKGALLKCD